MSPSWGFDSLPEHKNNPNNGERRQNLGFSTSLASPTLLNNDFETVNSNKDKMKYIRIKNQWLIEPQALHLVGASTKRNDASKIGQFGSGNKYAMAYLLRNNYANL